MNEQELVRAIKNQDPQAYKTLIDQYQKMVLNTCYGFVQDQDDAKDLTQDVFIEIIRSIDKFRGDAKLSTWLYRLAVNKSLNHLKKFKKRSLFGNVDSLTSSDQEKLSASNVYNADATVVNEERAKALKQAMASLSKNQRIAFTLHKVDGVSYAEIAEIMNVSTYSVESLIYRAKSSLQKKLLIFYKKNQD
jgi:RNA polymerase sigma-70 factor (ECF subfamily)